MPLIGNDAQQRRRLMLEERVDRFAKHSRDDLGGLASCMIPASGSWPSLRFTSCGTPLKSTRSGRRDDLAAAAAQRAGGWANIYGLLLGVCCVALLGAPVPGAAGAAARRPGGGKRLLPCGRLWSCLGRRRKPCLIWPGLTLPV